ncbi:MAG TPA: PilZ domain-containing protein [Bacillota bacterium]|nr:PilZ domain-containing protein [Bacillota bacterium]
MNDNSNYREYARLSSLILIKVILDDQNTVEALTEDIGFGGVKLRLPINLASNQEVRLMITHREKSFTVRGKCIWSNRIEQQTSDYYAGFTFLDDDVVTYENLRDILNDLADNDKMQL